MTTHSGAGGSSNQRRTAATVAGVTAILGLVKDVSDAFSHVPYIKSLAGLLVQILTIREVLYRCFSSQSLHPSIYVSGNHPLERPWA